MGFRSFELSDLAVSQVLLLIIISGLFYANKHKLRICDFLFLKGNETRFS